MSNDNPQNLSNELYSYRAQLKLERTPNLSAADIVKTGGGVSDAPEDNNTYGRRNGLWDRVIRFVQLASQGGTIPEINRTNTFTQRQTMEGDQNQAQLRLENTNGGNSWGFQSLDAGDWQVNGGGSGAVEFRLLYGGGFVFKDTNNDDGFKMLPDGSIVIAIPTGNDKGQGTLNVENGIWDNNNRVQRNQQFTVENLPTGNEGEFAYATNGLKDGETTGNGTGVPVYWSNGEWRVFRNDTVVQA